MHRALCIFALALLCACAGKSPEKKLLNDLDPAISWVGTLQFAAERWAANSVPAAFLRNSLDSGEQALEKGTETVDKSRASNDLRDRLRDELNRSMAAAEMLKIAVQKEDRAAAAGPLRILADSDAALRHMQQEFEER